MRCAMRRIQRMLVCVLAMRGVLGCVDTNESRERTPDSTRAHKTKHRLHSQHARRCGKTRRTFCSGTAPPLVVLGLGVLARRDRARRESRRAERDETRRDADRTPVPRPAGRRTTSTGPDGAYGFIYSTLPYVWTVTSPQPAMWGERDDEVEDPTGARPRKK